MCTNKPTPVAQQAPKTVGVQPYVQPYVQETLRIAEAPPNTCSGEIKLKSVNQDCFNSVSNTEYSDAPPSYPETDF